MKLSKKKNRTTLGLGDSKKETNISQLPLNDGYSYNNFNTGKHGNNISNLESERSIYSISKKEQEVNQSQIFAK
jgi:hypothetical protein